MNKKPALPDEPENHLVVFQEKAIHSTKINTSKKIRNVHIKNIPAIFMFLSV